MPADVKKRIFEPFFTTKPQGGRHWGWPLGCLGHRHPAHGGSIEVRTAGRARARAFRVSLPPAGRHAQGRAGRRPGSTPADARAARAGGRRRARDRRAAAETAPCHEARPSRSSAAAARRCCACRARPSTSSSAICACPTWTARPWSPRCASATPSSPGAAALITGDALGGARRGDPDAKLAVFEKPLYIAALRGEVRRLLDAA